MRPLAFNGGCMKVPEIKRVPTMFSGRTEGVLKMYFCGLHRDTGQMDVNLCEVKIECDTEYSSQFIAEVEVGFS